MKLEVGRFVSGSWFFIFPIFLLDTHRGRHASCATRLAPRPSPKSTLSSCKPSRGLDRLSCVFIYPYASFYASFYAALYAVLRGAVPSYLSCRRARAGVGVRRTPPKWGGPRGCGEHPGSHSEGSTAESHHCIRGARQSEATCMLLLQCRPNYGYNTS